MSLAARRKGVARFAALHLTMLAPRGGWSLWAQVEHSCSFIPNWIARIHSRHLSAFWKGVTSLS
jgi:hypothetical protein